MSTLSFIGIHVISSNRGFLAFFFWRAATRVPQLRPRSTGKTSLSGNALHLDPTPYTLIPKTETAL